MPGHTRKIKLLGDGSASSGIANDESFVLKFISLSITDKLYFYCTAHSTMIENFGIVDPNSTVTLNVTAGIGGLVQYTQSHSLGSPTTITATPDPGYIFTSWSGDATESDNPL